MTRRQGAVCGIGLVVLMVVAGAATLATLGHFNLAPAASRYASHVFGRRLTIGALHIHPGTVVTVKLRDLTLANAGNGDQPDMARITRLDAQVTPLSLVGWLLWRHPIVVRHLTIDGARLRLEHTANENPNWRFHGAKPIPRQDPRANFPILLDAHLHDAEIDLCHSFGHAIRIRLDIAGIATAAADQPVTLTATGAYNGTPLALSATL